MKKIVYNSWVARHIVLSGYSMITITAWVLTKYKNDKDMPQHVRNHESIHIRQWSECMIVSGIIIQALVLFANISSWWFLLSVGMFYVLYVLEWLLKLLFYGKEAYQNISFEHEAYDNQYNRDYLANCNYFRWMNYFFSEKREK